MTAFLNHLAVERHVAADTQNQALATLHFLYKDVLAEPLPWLDEVVHAKRPVRRPSVLASIKWAPQRPFYWQSKIYAAFFFGSAFLFAQ